MYRLPRRHRKLRPSLSPSAAGSSALRFVKSTSSGANRRAVALIDQRRIRAEVSCCCCRTSSPVNSTRAEVGGCDLPLHGLHARATKGFYHHGHLHLHTAPPARRHVSIVTSVVPSCSYCLLQAPRHRWPPTAAGPLDGKHEGARDGRACSRARFRRRQPG